MTTTDASGLGRLSPRTWWAAARVAGAGALAWLATHDPNEAGHYPACFLLQTTGWYCPVCGGTRSTYDLLHGDVAGAMARHPLVPPAYLAVGLYLLFRVVRARRGRPVRHDVPAWLPVALAVAVFAFGVVRNIPGWTWLSPA